MTSFDPASSPDQTFARVAEAPPREAAPPVRRARAVAVVLAVGAVAVVLAGVASPIFDLDRYLAPKALVLHLTALAVLGLGSPSLRPGRWGAVEWLLLAFVAWGAISAVLATNRWLAVQAWGTQASALVLLLAARELSPAYRRRVLGGVLAAAVLGASLGIVQAYGATWEWLADSRPPGGTFGNRNFLAHICVLALPPLAISTLRAGPRRGLVPALLGLALLAGAVVLTRSRAAWLGGIGGLGAMAVTLLLARGRAAAPLRAGVAAVAVTLAIGLAVTLPNRLAWNAESPYVATLSRLAEYGEGSGQGRLIQYENSLGLLLGSPLFGVGPGNWFVHYPRVTSSGDPSFSSHLTIPTNPWPSSDWVAFLAERGVIGALLLLVAGALAVGRALARVRVGDAEDVHAGAALVGLLVAALVTGFFDAVLLLAAPAYIVWTAAGLLLPEARRPLKWALGPRAHMAARAGAALVVLALAADAGARTAAIVVSGDGSREALERGARLAPGEHRLHLLLAEQGECGHARRAAALMPHHDNVQDLARGCSR